MRCVKALELALSKMQLIFVLPHKTTAGVFVGDANWKAGVIPNEPWF